MSNSVTLNDLEISKVQNKYKDYQDYTKENYVKYRFNYNNSIIKIYTTNKLLVQGKNQEIVFNEIMHLINKSSITTTASSNNVLSGNIIGTDEVGTGDVFGGIIVCACFVEKEKTDFLKQLGIKDSKKITDEDILKIAPILIKELTNAVVYLNNEKYNTVFSGFNLNKIKALMHNEAITKILRKVNDYDHIIIDGFTTPKNYFKYLEGYEVIENVNLIEKAEDKYLAVGASSIIARYYLIQNFNNLSKEYNYNFPKGASNKVDQLIDKIISDGNSELLTKVAKLNFKNFHRKSTNN